MTPAVSVIVVNWDRCELLRSCLASLERQTYSDFEIVVVDNGSSDGSVAYLDSVTGPLLRVVKLDANYGFTGGANAGIRIARGRYIALLNNDAEAEPDWLRTLAAALDADDTAGMAASKILFAQDPSRIDKVGHLIYMDGLNHGRGSGETDRGQFDRDAEVLFPDGAAAMYRKAMLDQVGLFDERFFAYGDDADLGLRGRWAGWRCLYVAGACVLHQRSATAGEFSPFKAFLIERNRLWVALKLWPWPLLLVSPAFTVVRLVFHAYGALTGTGSSGRFARNSRSALVLSMARAYLAAFAQLGGILRSRSEVRRFRCLGSGEFMRLLWKHRITVRDLTLKG
jgi:GT2 family glycosyltransferase